MSELSNEAVKYIEQSKLGWLITVDQLVKVNRN